MVCDEAQFLAEHRVNLPPGKFNTTKMNNTGFSSVFEYEYRSDKRVILQRNATGTPTGNLLLFDAEKREWNYLFMFSTYYDIDWLAINQREAFIGYRVNNFKVQWWFNYMGFSKVTRIFSNMWESNQTNWNLVENKLGQIQADGTLAFTALSWDAQDAMVAAPQTINGYDGGKMKVISNAGRNYWAAANPDLN